MPLEETRTLEEARKVAHEEIGGTLEKASRDALLHLLAEAYRGATGGNVAELCQRITEWRIDKGFDTSWLIVPEKLMLVVTELAEAMEAFRHLPKAVVQHLHEGTENEPGPGEWVVWEENFEEELADTFIRLFDLCGSLKINIADAIYRKMAKNELRPSKHGKEC